MNEQLTKGFLYEMEKQGFVKYLRVGAKRALPASIRKGAVRGARTFKGGFKASIPFTLGFTAFGEAMKPEHVSLDSPGDKVKRLGRDVATWGIGAGTWDVLSKALKGKSIKGAPAKGIARKVGRFAKKLPGKAGKLGLILGGSLAAEDLAGRALFGRRKEPKEIPLRRQPKMRKEAAALEPKKFKQKLEKGHTIKAPKAKRINPDKIKMSKGTMRNVSAKTKDILKKVKTR